MAKSQHNRNLGIWGERFAVKHIQEKAGFILAQNAKFAGVEVDILFIQKGVLVVCEVKTRTSSKFGHPLEVVTPERFSRLHRALNEAMKIHKKSIGRVDVIGIVLRPTPKIHHIQGISL
jgi:putative endonuclease